MQLHRPFKKLHLNFFKACIHFCQRLRQFRTFSLRRWCGCRRGRIRLVSPRFEELLANDLDLFRGQFAILIRVRFGKTPEYSSQLLCGRLLR